MNNKQTIRKEILERRNDLDIKTRERKSKIIEERLESLAIFSQAHEILFYYAVGSEVKTQELMKRTLSKKNLYLPVLIDEENFEAVRIQTLDLSKGKKGIPEPKEGERASTLELILVPGVAFTPKGHRLGTGQGYYDRFLKRFPEALKVGLCYEEQMIENFPVDPYDVPMDLLVTDERIYRLS